MNIFGKAFCFLTVTALAANLAACSTANIPPEEMSGFAPEPTSESGEPTTIAQASAAPRDYSALFSERDLSPQFDKIDGEIALNGTAKCDNSNVTIETDSTTTVTITAEGIYRLSGKLDGQIVVNAPKGKVQLILDNAEINSDSSAIVGIASDKIFISLAENSTNILSGRPVESDTEDTPDACIYSKDSITINGSGSLTISSTADGIHSKDDVVITGGTLDITADGDGIKGKDYIAVSDGSITVDSQQDGLKSTDKNSPDCGFIYIRGGEFDITSAQDGVQAETELVIDGGTFSISSGGGYENATKKQHDDFGGFDRDNFDKDFGDFGGMTPPDGNFGDFGGKGKRPNESENSTATDSSEASDDDSVSTKGLKAAELTINSGNFTINSADDALHSNGNIAINGGSLEISAGDDGIHADAQLDIFGGSVDILHSYEGIEAAVINIHGGDVGVVSSDDGFNASDGTPQNGLGTYSENVSINISGGTVTVNAQGDGIDSNGGMTFSGGNIVVHGPVSGADAALDSNGEYFVNGGLLIAAGSSGMLELPSTDSQQNIISVTFDSTYQKGTTITLTDENGSELIAYTSEKSFDNVIISAPEIKSGSKYTINADGEAVETITIERSVTTIGKSTGFGGFGGFPGGNKGDFQIPTDENGDFSMPDGDFPNGGFPGGGRGDFQPTTDENGSFIRPDKGGRGSKPKSS